MLRSNLGVCSIRSVAEVECFNIFDIFSGYLFMVIMMKKEKQYTKMFRKSEFLIINTKKYIL